MNKYQNKARTEMGDSHQTTHIRLTATFKVDWHKRVSGQPPGGHG